MVKVFISIVLIQYISFNQQAIWPIPAIGTTYYVLSTLYYIVFIKHKFCINKTHDENEIKVLFANIV